MAWQWSHTPEAYSNVEANIKAKPREWLEVVFAEWRASQNKRGIPPRTGTHKFNERKYNRALAYAKRPDITAEWLAEFIWQMTQDLATCTNGGWEAWCCPFGCGCHTVPFELEAVAE